VAHPYRWFVPNRTRARHILPLDRLCLSGETSEGLTREDHGKRRGKRLKEAREDRGFTQDTFAEALGVDRGTVSRWERGVTETREDHWQAIERVLRLHREWVLGGGDSPVPPPADRSA
jgi:DNA-binding XRE family transcriptional regulator